LPEGRPEGVNVRVPSVSPATRLELARLVRGAAECERTGKDADGLEGARVRAGDEIDLDGADGIDPGESEGLALTNIEDGVGDGGLREANSGEAGDDSSGELHGDLCG
jgi:hypothetical protein